MLVVIGVSSLGEPAAMSFAPMDFADNVQGREYVSVDEEVATYTYDPESVVRDDEGRILGDDLLTAKFAIGSGAYVLSVDYEADELNGYVELYSLSGITEMVADKIWFEPGRTQVSSMVYIPFGRSMHDVQMNIHYTGPGTLKVYGISLREDTSYRWVPVVGYLLLFGLLDFVLYLLFARSAGTAREYIRKHWELPAILFIIMLASLPTFADFLYVGHDMQFHLARIIAVSREISYGQFPVRMLTDMLQGYSYPTSTFYCDFFLYPFALLYLLGLPLRMCWQSYVIAVNILTAGISYFSFRRISSGSRSIGVVGAAIYTLSAYRIVDIYLRSAMGEFTALAFIPVVVLGIWIIYFEEAEDWHGWLYLGFGMLAIALCHLLSLEMISIFLIVFCLLEYRKTFTAYRLLSIIKAAAMTVLLSCWFIFPMLLAMRDISLSMYDHQTYIQAEGAYPSQVFNIFMRGWGYSTTATPMEMPLSIGGGMIVALGLLIYRMIGGSKADRRLQRTGLVLVSLSLVFSMYFFPWDSIASLTESRLQALSRLARMVQYPWRFLEITTVVLCVTAVVGLGKVKEDGSWHKGRDLWILLLLLGTVLSLCSFYNPFISETQWTRANDETYIESSIGREEYLPSDAGRLVDLPHEVEIAEGGDIDVSSYDAVGGERRLSVSNHGGEGEVLIPVFAYPGFHAEDMDTHESISFTSGTNARIALAIPAGYSGVVRVYYKEPMTWRVFEIISLATLAGLVLYTVYKRNKSSRGKYGP